MDKIEIEGGRTLSGRVEISGAKNAALPILISSLLLLLMKTWMCFYRGIRHWSWLVVIRMCKCSAATGVHS